VKGKKKVGRNLNPLKKAPVALRKKKYRLCLYVAGATERSRKAVLRARELCETELKDDYELHVIDVYQQPILAREGQILATPTLVRELPHPCAG
jgi:circadian clock protein KaiB